MIAPRMISPRRVPKFNQRDFDFVLHFKHKGYVLQYFLIITNLHAHSKEILSRADIGSNAIWLYMFYRFDVLLAIRQFITPSRLRVKSYFTGSGPFCSNSNSKSRKRRDTPNVTSVSPRRVPRQPRGPAPNGSHEKEDGAPPFMPSASHL